MTLTPFKYYGGKTAQLKYILPIINSTPHTCYVEAFGGSGAVLLNKKPSEIEVYNDLDELIVNFFRVLQNPQKFKTLLHMLSNTLYSRSEFMRAKKILIAETDDVLRAWALFVVFRQSFSGGGQGWSYDVSEPRHMPQVFYRVIDEKLFLIHQRLRNVYIECDDAFKVIQRYDEPTTLFFFDPPYPPSTINAELPYTYKMSEEQHMEFAEILRSLQGNYVLTTYPTDYYDALPHQKIVVKLPLHPAVSNKAKKRLPQAIYVKTHKQAQTLLNWV